MLSWSITGRYNHLQSIWPYCCVGAVDCGCSSDFPLLISPPRKSLCIYVDYSRCTLLTGKRKHKAIIVWNTLFRSSAYADYSQIVRTTNSVSIPRVLSASYGVYMHSLNLTVWYTHRKTHTFKWYRVRSPKMSMADREKRQFAVHVNCSSNKNNSMHNDIVVAKYTVAHKAARKLRYSLQTQHKTSQMRSSSKPASTHVYTPWTSSREFEFPTLLFLVRQPARKREFTSDQCSSATTLIWSNCRD